MDGYHIWHPDDEFMHDDEREIVIRDRRQKKMEGYMVGWIDKNNMLHSTTVIASGKKDAIRRVKNSRKTWKHLSSVIAVNM
jgi:hypothetical protein